MGSVRAAQESRNRLTAMVRMTSADASGRRKPSVYLRPTAQQTSSRPAMMSTIQADDIPVFSYCPMVKVVEIWPSGMQSPP